MSKKKQPLEWFVLYENFNGKKIEPFNVFEHGSFLEDTKKNYKKNKENFEAFKKQLDIDAHYYFWSKCQAETIWTSEITVSSLIESRKESIKTKIDIFDQLQLNWDYFVQYTWNWFTNK